VELALDRRRVGYALGWFGLPMRLGAGRHVAFAMEADIDGPSELPRWFAIGPDGRLQHQPMKRVPVELLDITGDGRDVLATLSTELYLEYLVTGTMDLVRWRDGKLHSLLPGAMFELCALEPDDGGPLWIAAVSRKGAILHWLNYNGTEERYESVWKTKVSPPEERKPYNVPRGFALACTFPRERPHKVQYKNRVFLVAEGGRRLIEKTAAKGAK